MPRRAKTITDRKANARAAKRQRLIKRHTPDKKPDHLTDILNEPAN
jgi:hypothetical protein